MQRKKELKYHRFRNCYLRSIMPRLNWGTVRWKKRLDALICRLHLKFWMFFQIKTHEWAVVNLTYMGRYYLPVTMAESFEQFLNHFSLAHFEWNFFTQNYIRISLIFEYIHIYTYHFPSVWIVMCVAVSQRNLTRSLSWMSVYYLLDGIQCNII